MSTTATAANTSPSKGLHVGLWVAQGLLAAMFLLSGSMKLTAPIADLMSKMSWVSADMTWLPRFIGASEVAGALGLILPSALRIQPKLTVAAAVGLLVVMVLAAGTHAMKGEYGVIGVNVVLGGLAAFVAWGRLNKAPIAAK